MDRNLSDYECPFIGYQDKVYSLVEEVRRWVERPPEPVSPRVEALLMDAAFVCAQWAKAIRPASRERPERPRRIRAA